MVTVPPDGLQKICSAIPKGRLWGSSAVVPDGACSVRMARAEMAARRPRRRANVRIISRNRAFTCSYVVRRDLTRSETIGALAAKHSG